MGDHDQLFKRAFRVPANAAGELAAVLPADVLADLDLDSLEALPGDHVDSRLGERFADALFRARFRGAEGYVFFLLEHQSSVDAWMPLRVVEEMARIWRELQRSAPERRLLPPTLCVVVYQGESAWTGPRRMQDLIDGASPANARFIPAFDLVIDDLGLQSDADLAGRPLASFPKLVLWALRDGRSASRLREHFGAWTATLGRLATRSPEDIVTLLRYIRAIAGEGSFVQLKDEIVRSVPTSETAMISIAEQFMQETERRIYPVLWEKAQADAKAVARAEVKAELKAEAKAEAVLAILEARGLAVASGQRARILACADLGTLDGWLRTAITCDRSEALFAH